MGLVTCLHCGQEFEEGVLCCPHCGTAQIPQLSKAELRLEHMKESRGPLGAMYLGLALGLLLGVVVFVIAAVQGSAGMEHAMGIVLGGLLGSSLGFLWHRFFGTERR